MKIALICDSLLLDRSLEMYLKEYLTSYKLCDFVVATQPTESQKPVFLIGDFENAQLKVPFTRELLLQELESFYQQLQGKNAISAQENPQNASQNLPKDTGVNLSFADYQRGLDQTDLSTQSTGTHMDLNAKIEDILRRYAREIQKVIEDFHKESQK